MAGESPGVEASDVGLKREDGASVATSDGTLAWFGRERSEAWRGGDELGVEAMGGAGRVCFLGAVIGQVTENVSKYE